MGNFRSCSGRSQPGWQTHIIYRLQSPRHRQISCNSRLWLWHSCNACCNCSPQNPAMLSVDKSGLFLAAHDSHQDWPGLKMHISAMLGEKIQWHRFENEHGIDGSDCGSNYVCSLYLYCSTLAPECTWWTRPLIMYCPECTRGCPPSALFNQQRNWRVKTELYTKFWRNFKPHRASGATSRHGKWWINQLSQNKPVSEFQTNNSNEHASYNSALLEICIQVKTDYKMSNHNCKAFYRLHYGKQGVVWAWFERWWHVGFAFSQNKWFIMLEAYAAIWSIV